MKRVRVLKSIEVIQKWLDSHISSIERHQESDFIVNNRFLLGNAVESEDELLIMKSTSEESPSLGKQYEEAKRIQLAMKSLARTYS